MTAENIWSEIMPKFQPITIHIKDLTLKTIVGIFAWERVKKQKIVINLWMDYDAGQAIKTDQIEHAVDYKAITKLIIKDIQASHFFLIEKLAQKVVDIAFSDRKVLKVMVRVDKPGALRYARSVAVEFVKKRSSR